MLIIIEFSSQETVAEKTDRVLLECFMKDLGYIITQITCNDLERSVSFYKREGIPKKRKSIK